VVCSSTEEVDKLEFRSIFRWVLRHYEKGAEDGSIGKRRCGDVFRSLLVNHVQLGESLAKTIGRLLGLISEAEDEEFFLIT